MQQFILNAYYCYGEFVVVSLRIMEYTSKNVSLIYLQETQQILVNHFL